MDYNQDDPAMDVEQQQQPTDSDDPMAEEGQGGVDDEEMMDVEDIPVSQEDSWAVIRYDIFLVGVELLLLPTHNSNVAVMQRLL